jgi:methyl-accepting chemotaxis protein
MINKGSRMLLKQKFILVGILVIAAIVTIMGLEQYTLHKVRIFNSLAVNISHVESAMLQLRRDEKDFLARNDTKYQDKFTENYQHLQSDIKALKKAILDAGLAASKVNELDSKFLNYQQLFNNLVATQKIIGLNPKDGLYGELRSAVHAAETEIKSINNHQLRADMLQLRRDEKDFMLRSDEKYLEQFNKDLETFNSNLLGSGIAADKQQSIGKLMGEYSNKFTALTSGYSQKGLNSNSGILGEMRTAVHDAEILLESIATEMKLTIKNEIGSIDKLNDITTVFGAAIAIILLGVMAWIAQGILRPLQHFMKTMWQATEENNLALRVEISTKDEVAQTAKAFNDMLTKFQQIIHIVNHSSQEITTATEKLSATASNACENIQTQEAQTQQLSTAMHEMAATVRSVADNAESAAAATAEANKECIASRHTVSTAGATINNLAKSVQNAADAINLVEEDSNRIGSVLDVIRSIAEQTNLLALNAAIEAARAGEQGRGFAVVADEVRTLAGRTQSSTQEIQQMIESLQARSQEAVSLMTDSHQQTQMGVEQTHSVNTALAAISKTVDAINTMNTEIATAANQQSQVTEEVNRNVIKIDQIAEESSQHALQISSASTELKKLVKELQKASAQFKV